MTLQRSYDASQVELLVDGKRVDLGAGRVDLEWGRVPLDHPDVDALLNVATALGMGMSRQRAAALIADISGRSATTVDELQAKFIAELKAMMRAGINAGEGILLAKQSRQPTENGVYVTEVGTFDLPAPAPPPGQNRHERRKQRAMQRRRA